MSLGHRLNVEANLCSKEYDTNNNNKNLDTLNKFIAEQQSHRRRFTNLRSDSLLYSWSCLNVKKFNNTEQSSTFGLTRRLVESCCS